MKIFVPFSLLYFIRLCRSGYVVLILSSDQNADYIKPDYVERII